MPYSKEEEHTKRWPSGGRERGGERGGNENGIFCSEVKRIMRYSLSLFGLVLFVFCYYFFG